MKLPTFTKADLPGAVELTLRVGDDATVRKVIHYALGPAGTNISQAAVQWSRRMGVEHKSEVILCTTPEDAVRQAREISEPGVLPLFWTCAVYFRENELFFENPDTLPFLFAETMNLDEMQLAVRHENRALSPGMLVASHLSPAPLVKEAALKVVQANSNAAAAQMCASGKVDACITTESARRIHSLRQVHSFGSPPMVFFGGTTKHGIAVLGDR